MTESADPTTAAWTAYATSQPETPGVYRWRVPSVPLPGAFVVFDAHFRKRGAGYVQTVSPAFDHWDGYRVHVPAGTEWRATSAACKEYEYKNLGIDGLSFLPCPFCEGQPRLSAVEGAVGGGVIIGGKPHRYNSWWLECCRWGTSPHLRDPREIERIRTAAFRRAAALAESGQ